jgi:hypothetical protein
MGGLGGDKLPANNGFAEKQQVIEESLKNISARETSKPKCFFQKNLLCGQYLKHSK